MDICIIVFFFFIKWIYLFLVKIYFYEMLSTLNMVLIGIIVLIICLFIYMFKELLKLFSVYFVVLCVE